MPRKANTYRAAKRNEWRKIDSPWPGIKPTRYEPPRSVLSRARRLKRKALSIIGEA